LNGLNVTKAKREVKRKRLTKTAIKSLPEELPLTRGRVHFIRQVSNEGKIKVMGESYKVSKSMRGEYVWATIEIGRNRNADLLSKKRKSQSKTCQNDTLSDR
jgi:hypothetical protein